MEKQPKDSGSTGAGNAKGTDAGTKAGTVEIDVKDLQKEIRELSNHLKEIKNVIKLLLKDRNNKIPGIK
tara:strand:- start:146 stop:352 length:207 start_codon:yes stop_codon:yes gene_type:complete